MANSNPPSQYISPISRIKLSFLLLITANISPYLLSLCRWPISTKHYIALNLFALASIIYIVSAQVKPNPIQQVFEAKSIHVNNQYPILLKGDNQND